MEMTIVQWATILSPIIAVILAWWTCRSGASDTAKLIQCAKKFMLINLRTKIIELSKEAKEEHVQFSSLLKKSKELSKFYYTRNPDCAKESLGQSEEMDRNTDDKIDITFDRRMVIAETMTDIIKLIKEIEKM